MNSTVISSPATFPMKVVFPVIWLSLFGWATAHFMSGGTSMRWGGGIQPPWWAKWVFLAALIGGSWLFGRVCIPLKKITLEGRNLTVSNYLREATFSLDEVAEIGLVSGMRLNNSPVAYITLTRESPFGKDLLFYPRSEADYNRLRSAVGTRAAAPARDSPVE